MKDKALMLASVASMIDQFNMRNIKILQGLGYKVEVACNFDDGNTTNSKRINSFKKELRAKGVEFYNIPIPRQIKAVGDIVRSYYMVKELVEKQEYKLVHCHSPIGGVIARLACRNARRKGTKVAYTAHGFHFFKGSGAMSWLIFYNLEKYCSRFTDLLITINKEDYEKGKGLSAKNTVYVPGIGIDTQSLGIAPEPRAEIKKSLGISEDSFVVISVGQLSRRKNHQAIIRAVAEIAKADMYYVICGLGELEAELKALAQELGVGDRVIFTGYRTDIGRLIHGAEVFAFPSRQEGLPVSLMEAMSAGLGCVASRIRGNTDLMQDNNNEFLIDIDDVQGYKNAIERLYNDRELLAEAGKRNKEAVKAFDKAVVDEEMTRLYGELVIK